MSSSSQSLPSFQQAFSNTLQLPPLRPQINRKRSSDRVLENPGSDDVEVRSEPARSPKRVRVDRSPPIAAIRDEPQNEPYRSTPGTLRPRNKHTTSTDRKSPSIGIPSEPPQIAHSGSTSNFNVSPGSFARTRGSTRKPADLHFGSHSNASILSPQSAPPTQLRFNTSSSSIALPSLPPIIMRDRRVAGGLTRNTGSSSLRTAPAVHNAAARVPSTPSVFRTSFAQAASQQPGLAVPHAGVPPARTPTTSTAPPPSSAEKAAFLAPFEAFYDTLADARTLKAWLADQARTYENLTRLVDEAVERRVREETSDLRKRVSELENLLSQQQEGVSANRSSENGMQVEEEEKRSSPPTMSVSAARHEPAPKNHLTEFN